MFPNSIELTRLRRDQSDRVAIDTVPCTGSINRGHQELANKRRLTLNMIRRLTRSLGIPPEVFVSQHQEDVEAA